MKLFWVVLIIGAIAIIAWVRSLPVPGEACSVENETKFHSTGKVVVCQNGRWVLMNGMK